jgi:hypothetical protein
MKKIFLILGGIFAVILVVLGIVAAIFIPRLIKLDREATAYIKDAVPRIAANWDSQDLVDRATPELLSAAKTRKEIDRLFVLFRHLGALKHLDKPKGMVSWRTFTGTGTVTFGNYTVEGQFQQGAATIEIQLRRVGNTWKINGFRINSDTFLPASE